MDKTSASISVQFFENMFQSVRWSLPILYKYSATLPFMSNSMRRTALDRSMADLGLKESKDLARKVVFDSNGLPRFEGQALRDVQELAEEMGDAGKQIRDQVIEDLQENRELAEEAKKECDTAMQKRRKKWMLVVRKSWSHSLHLLYLLVSVFTS